MVSPDLKDERDVDIVPGTPLVTIEIDGYRPFRNYRADPGPLTVIIGANASGKSSLFDFLRFVRQAVLEPLPPEIDTQSAGKVLFHANGPERIHFALTVDMGQRVPLRYEVTILGPIGAPRVARERLATAQPLHTEEAQPFVFLDFTGGQGVVRDPQQRRLRRPEWSLRSNELALRRALDPTLTTLSRVQELIASWRFYSGFDLATSAAIRRPVPTEPEPRLSEDGSNLSAVLFWLMTQHPEVWEELETHLGSAIPVFRSLSVKAMGGPGTVMGVWREDEIARELTLADLSDGTLRFLCWAVLARSPDPPPLLTVDEPELGLHPRVLPTLAGLFHLTTERAQVLLATHSPYFLSQFSLEEIAVMRKEAGSAVFARPGSSRALRRLVEDMGDEALARLHISEEMEIMP